MSSRRSIPLLVPINTQVDSETYQSLGLIFQYIALPATSVVIAQQLSLLYQNRSIQFIQHALDQYNSFRSSRLIPMDQIHINNTHILVNDTPHTSDILVALRHLHEISGKGSHDSTQSFGGLSFAGPERLNQDLIHQKLQDLYRMNLSDLPDSTATLLQNSGILLKPMSQWDAAVAVLNRIRNGS